MQLFVILCSYFWKEIENNFLETAALVAIIFHAKWCAFQPSRSKTVGEGTFLAAIHVTGTNNIHVTGSIFILN